MRTTSRTGEEGDEDVRFDAVLALAVDRADGQIAPEILERFFDLYHLQVVIPQLRRIGVSEIGAQ